MIQKEAVIKLIQEAGNAFIDKYHQSDMVDEFVDLIEAVEAMPEEKTQYDALVEDLRGHGAVLCNTCVHRDEPEVCEDSCSDCGECPKYTWRGEKENEEQI